MPTPRLFLLTLLALPIVACGGSGGGGGPTAPPARATVTFVYQASTTTDPQVAALFPGCVAGVGHTHIHPGWRSFGRVDMIDAGDRWTAGFADVPVGSRQRIRVSDPNACADNATGASTRNVFANGVLLTDVVDTPGTGIEPGLAFTVAADGTVSP